MDLNRKFNDNRKIKDQERNSKEQKKLFINLEETQSTTGEYQTFGNSLENLLLNKKSKNSPQKTSIKLQNSKFQEDILDSESTDSIKPGQKNSSLNMQPEEEEKSGCSEYELSSEEEVSLGEEEINKYEENKGDFENKEKNETEENSANLNNNFFNLEPDQKDYDDSSSVGTMSISEEDFFIKRKDMNKRKILGFRNFIEEKRGFLNKNFDIDEIIRTIEDKSHDLSIEILLQLFAPKGTRIGFKELCMLRFVETYFDWIFNE